MKHLIDPFDLSKEEIDEIVALGEDIVAHRDRYSGACKGKKLATLFYEPSTRTRLSFTSAMMELGGDVIGFSDARNTSVSKGETIEDTTRVISCFADIIAMRHPIEGAPLNATRVSTIPVINAGDGSHAHPTQTLTDLLTIKRELGRLDNFTIGFCGDLKFGRTVHSLDKAKMSLAKDSMVVLHPLPRVNEILKEVDDDPRAAYFRQVENGKFVRMALIVKLLEWAKQDPSVHWMVPSDAIRSGYSCPNRKCISNVENVDPLFRMDDDGVCHCIYCESKARSL